MAVAKEISDLREYIEGECGERRGVHHYRCNYANFKDVPCDCFVGRHEKAHESLDRLRDWKESAMSVIADWEAVGDALEVDKIGTLGEKKSAIALREVVRLREVNAELLAIVEDAEHDIRQRARPGEDWLERARKAIAKAQSTTISPGKE